MTPSKPHVLILVAIGVTLVLVQHGLRASVASSQARARTLATLRQAVQEEEEVQAEVEHLFGNLSSVSTTQPDYMASWQTAWEYTQCLTVPPADSVSFDSQHKRWRVDPLPALRVYLYPLRGDAYSLRFLQLRQAFQALADRGRVELMDDPATACLRVPAMDPFEWSHSQGEEYLAWISSQATWNKGRNHVFIVRHDRLQLPYDHAWLVRTTASMPYLNSRSMFDLVLPLPLALADPDAVTLLSASLPRPTGCTSNGVCPDIGARLPLLVFNSSHFPLVDDMGDSRKQLRVRLRRFAAQFPEDVVDVHDCLPTTTASTASGEVAENDGQRSGEEEALRRSRLMQTCFRLLRGVKVASFALVHGSPGVCANGKQIHNSLPSLVESMGAGMVPVILNDYYPDPLATFIHPQRYNLHISSSALDSLLPVLRRLVSNAPKRYASMQRVGAKLHALLATPHAITELITTHVVRRTMLYGFRIDMVGRQEVWEHMYTDEDV